jgi:hypothetical protein
MKADTAFETPLKSKICRSPANNTFSNTCPLLVHYEPENRIVSTRRSEKANGGSWKGVLPKETIGHIQSAGCIGQKEVVTAAYNACIRELLQEIEVHGKADRHMKLLTLEKESSLGSLWDQEQCAQFCTKDELWEAAKEEEMKIPWKEAQEGLPKERRSLSDDKTCAWNRVF